MRRQTPQLKVLTASPQLNNSVPTTKLYYPLHQRHNLSYLNKSSGSIFNKQSETIPAFSNRVWCSGNIVDSHFLEVSDLSTARGSTPRIRVSKRSFFFISFFFQLSATTTTCYPYPYRLLIHSPRLSLPHHSKQKPFRFLFDLLLRHQKNNNKCPNTRCKHSCSYKPSNALLNSNF